MAHRFTARPVKLHRLGEKVMKQFILSPRLPFLGRAVGRSGGHPDFLIIGAQKGGTTSLFHYLAAHSRVMRARKKEVHFFSFNYGCGEAWYRGHFPDSRRGEGGFQTGEASPYYLYLPDAAERAAAFDPQLKLIALLREPVSRAYSHYHMSVRRGREPLSFENAVEQEAGRLQQEEARFGPERAFTHGISHRYHSYLKRGYYVEQLERWLAHFPREQLLVLRSEDFFGEPDRVYQNVLSFLELPPEPLRVHRRFNAAPKPPPLPEVLQQQLRQHFAPYNTRLEKLLGRPFYPLTAPPAHATLRRVANAQTRPTGGVGAKQFEPRGPRP